jgi:hypothetical protein
MSARRAPQGAKPVAQTPSMRALSVTTVTCYRYMLCINSSYKEVSNDTFD